jgi:hypothetical protein
MNIATTNIIKFADKGWLEKMGDKDWPSFCHFLIAFIAGFGVLTVLYVVVLLTILALRHKGGVSEDSADIKKVALSHIVAGIEQFIFYLAAIAGTQIFGFAVGGWLLFKAVSRYARWEVSRKANDFEAALAHNRRQIFLIGTLMSITAGGLAGFFYHFYATYP